MGTFQFKPLQGGHLSKADKNFCPVSVRFREVPLYFVNSKFLKMIPKYQLKFQLTENMVFPKVVYFNIVFTFISCIKDCLKRNLSKLCAVSKCNRSNSMSMRLFSICDKIKSFQILLSLKTLPKLLHYLWSADLSKRFSHLTVPLFTFSLYFF